MEENLDPIIDVNKKISDNTNNSKSEEIKEPSSEKLINVNKNNTNPQNNFAPNLDIKNESNKSSERIPIAKKELPTKIISPDSKVGFELGESGLFRSNKNFLL